jgi:hypothetical protein
MDETPREVLALLSEDLRPWADQHLRLMPSGQTVMGMLHLLRLVAVQEAEAAERQGELARDRESEIRAAQERLLAG